MPNAINIKIKIKKSNKEAIFSLIQITLKIMQILNNHPHNRHISLTLNSLKKINNNKNKPINLTQIFNKIIFNRSNLNNNNNNSKIYLSRANNLIIKEFL